MRLRMESLHPSSPTHGWPRMWRISPRDSERGFVVGEALFVGVSRTSNISSNTAVASVEVDVSTSALLLLVLLVLVLGSLVL